MEVLSFISLIFLSFFSFLNFPHMIPKAPILTKLCISFQLHLWNQLQQEQSPQNREKIEVELLKEGLSIPNRTHPLSVRITEFMRVLDINQRYAVSV